MTPEESEFVDRIGLFMELLGGSRTMGRVYGWLMIADPPEQSLTALADTLSVSKASVSTVARQLQEGGLIERLPSASRQHRYRVRPGGFTSVLSVQLSRMKLGIEAADFGLAILDGDRPDQRERLEDFKHFCEFSSQAYHDEMLRLWADYRQSQRRGVMTTNKVDFSAVRWGSVEWTNLCTLYLRACESRLAQPVLGDHAAAEAVDRIDYDFKRMHRASQPWANQFLVGLRAKQLDDWTNPFLTRHPDAVVLHLGCGLDTRAFRVRRPETVDWFDVDQPGVVELRRKLYDDGPGYRMIGSSVTDAGWLDEVPTGRPTLIVAEGLLMYLDERDVRELLQRLTDRFEHGEIDFDTIAPIGPKLSRLFSNGMVKWGISDMSAVERWIPRLRLIDRVPAYANYRTIPLAPQRLLLGFFNATLAGRYDVLNQFRF